MDIKKCIKESFCVIGKQGSTNDGEGFIGRLWEDANGHFNEVAPLAKKDEKGIPVGVWGAMSDFSKSFNPWEEGFTKGLTLPELKLRMEPKRLRAGRNGLFRHMSISVLRSRKERRIFFLK